MGEIGTCCNILHCETAQIRVLCLQNCFVQNSKFILRTKCIFLSEVLSYNTSFENEVQQYFRITGCKAAVKYVLCENLFCGLLG